MKSGIRVNQKGVTGSVAGHSSLIDAAERFLRIPMRRSTGNCICLTNVKLMGAKSPKGIA